MAVKFVDPNKEKLILTALNKPNTVKGVTRETGIPLRTTKEYLERLVALGKIKDLKTYPYSYKRIPRNQWPESKLKAVVSTEETPVIDVALVAQIITLLKSDEVPTDPIIRAIKEYLSALDRGLEPQAAVNVIDSAVEAFKQIIKDT